MQRTFLLYCLVTISVTIIFPSILYPQDMFIIGAEDVSGRWEFAHGSPPHSSDFWDTVKSFGLNYAGLKYFQSYAPDIGYIDSSDILAELDSAESRDIKVFLYNGFDIDRGDVVINPLRWVYQLEETDNPATVDFLNIIDAPNDFDDDALTHWDLADPIVQNPNFIL
jgi:hypothetical protein